MAKKQRGIIMPRSGRRLSTSKTYHVMIRGNERKAIFFDDDDRVFFVSTMAIKNMERRFAVYAYCLMDNHVHLIIYEGEEGISRIMKRIQVSYVYYFNKKYGRSGHLFQDRFKSEAVEDEQYLLTAIRYIHHNPVKAQIVSHPSEYRWSSYNLYLGNAAGYPKNLVEVGPVLTMFADNPQRAVQLFALFSAQQAEEVFIEYQDNSDQDKEIKTASEAESYIVEFLNQSHIERTQLHDVNYKTARYELILELKRRSNLSNRQIAALLNVNRNIVQRVG
jgi:putative transposase